jgi:hypothetical protein
MSDPIVQSMHRATNAAVIVIFEAGTMVALLPKIGLLGRAGRWLWSEGTVWMGNLIAKESTFLVETGLQFSIHSLKRIAQRGVTPKMAEVAIRKGKNFYDPLNKTINYILPNGFGSGKSLLVGTNPLTGEITTVIRSSKNLIKPRMIPIK